MKRTNWWATFLTLIAGLLAGNAAPPVINPPTPGPTKDTIQVSTPTPTPAPKPPVTDTSAPIVTKPDTTIIKVPPSKDTTVIVVALPYRTLLADSANYTTTAQLAARISKNVGGTCTTNCLYNDGPNAGKAVVDNTVLYKGHPTVAYKQEAGSGLIPEMWVGIQGGSKHLWVREVLRFSPGWSTNGTISGSKAYKMFGFSYLGSEGSGRLEISNGTQYQLYWGVGTIAPQTFDLEIGNITTEWTDGNFYTYIYDIDFSAGKSGTVRMWMAKDGETPKLRGTVAIPANGTLPPLGAVNFGMNFNQAQRTGMPAQQINYGMWEIVDGAKYQNPFGV